LSAWLIETLLPKLALKADIDEAQGLVLAHGLSFWRRFGCGVSDVIFAG
jgi:hypothetical protein